MENKAIDSLTLYFDQEERVEAEIIEKACQKSVQIITETWDLKTPSDCMVYVMNSWPRCVFLGAPQVYKIFLAITMPLWYREFKLRWKFAGGWAQKYGERQVVGIKAPRLIEQTPDSMGIAIFHEIDNIEDKVTSIACHELTHAFTSHLSLPVWLNEGLAMVTVDCCLKRTTVIHESLNFLNAVYDDEKPLEKIDLKSQSREQITRIYIRGYWFTRYLLETQPELLKGFLVTRFSNQEIESKIAEVYGIDQAELWDEIERKAFNYFLETTIGNSK